VKNGFTAIEMIISLFVVAITAILLASFSQSMMSTFGKIENAKSLVDTVQLVRSTLEKNVQCRLNLKNLPLAFPQAQDTPVTLLASFDPKTQAASGRLAAPGQIMNGAIVQTLSLRPVRQIETSLLMAELQIEFRPQGLRNPADTSQNLTRLIPLVARVQNGLITDCWVKTEKSSVDVDNICMQISGGAANSFDTATGSCKLANGKWIHGTLTSASCPAGSYLPPGAQPGNFCGSSGNFDDDKARQDVQMQDGTTARFGREPVLYDFSGSNTCSCDWAADLTAADLAGAECMILCVVP